MRGRRSAADLAALDLRAFEPGAAIRGADGTLHRFANPARRPSQAFATAVDGLFDVCDKALLLGPRPRRRDGRAARAARRRPARRGVGARAAGEHGAGPRCAHRRRRAHRPRRGRGTDRAPLPEPAVRRELARIYGRPADGWTHLHTAEVRAALPAFLPGHAVRRDVVLGDGLFVAGDHRDTPSTQGALVSGRRAAEAVRWPTSGSERPQQA